jgi:hypothetical protein
MGKELDYLTKLYLVKAFNVRKIVLMNWIEENKTVFYH